MKRLNHLVVAALAVTTVTTVGATATTQPAPQLLSTVIVMHGSGTPFPPPSFVDGAMEKYIRPTNPGLEANPNVVPLWTPEQVWPLTGLTSHTFDVSVRLGFIDLARELVAPGVTEPTIVFGISQSAVIATEMKRALATLYPGPNNLAAPDITFVLPGNLNRPNGGVMTRFWGFHIPILNFTFNGPAPTDTSFTTYDIAREYDGFADFPNYPGNAISTLNAIMGIVYLHPGYLSPTVGLDPNDPTKYLQGQHGDTTYYFIPTSNDDLPILQPFRGVVPAQLLDVLEPVLRVIIDAGYDRSIDPWVPTPAQPIPRINPFDFANDLSVAIAEGLATLAPSSAPTVTDDVDALSARLLAPGTAVPEATAPEATAGREVINPEPEYVQADADPGLTDDKAAVVVDEDLPTVGVAERTTSPRSATTSIKTRTMTPIRRSSPDADHDDSAPAAGGKPADSTSDVGGSDTSDSAGGGQRKQDDTSPTGKASNHRTRGTTDENETTNRTSTD